MKSTAVPAIIGLALALSVGLAPSTSWGQSGAGSIKLLTTETDYGKRHEIMESEPFVFSPDRKRLAYWAYEPVKPNSHKYGKVYVVVNGVPGKSYDYIYYDNPRASNYPPGDIIFSPDSRHIAYRGLRGTSWMVVRDGKEDKPFIQKVQRGVWEYYDNRGTDVIDDIVWSPDSRHLAYRARRNQKWRVVLDGKEGKLFDWIADNDLHFSSDSKRLAYHARRGSRDIIVLHAGAKVREMLFKPHPPQPKTAAQNPAGDTQTDHTKTDQASIVQHAGKQAVLWNGREGTAYDQIAHVTTGPNDQHLAYWARRGKQWLMVVDGVEGKSYQDGAQAEPFVAASDTDPDYVDPGHHLDPLVFDSPQSLHTMALRADGHIAWVRVAIVEP